PLPGRAFHRDGLGQDEDMWVVEDVDADLAGRLFVGHPYAPRVPSLVEGSGIEDRDATVQVVPFLRFKDAHPACIAAVDEELAARQAGACRIPHAPLLVPGPVGGKIALGGASALWATGVGPAD